MRGAACQRTELEASKPGILLTLALVLLEVVVVVVVVIAAAAVVAAPMTQPTYRENTTYEGCRIFDAVNRFGLLSGCIMSKP